MSSQDTRRKVRLNEKVESRVRGDLYARFGGECLETCYCQRWQGAGCLAYGERRHPLLGNKHGPVHAAELGAECGLHHGPRRGAVGAFLADSRYATERIGIYEGACTYMTGVYRPTEESMMNSNTSGFNAPFRKAVYDGVMKRGSGRETTYKEFVSFDLQIQVLSRNISQISAPAGRPFPHPQFTGRRLKKK